MLVKSKEYRRNNVLLLLDCAFGWWHVSGKWITVITVVTIAT